MSLEKLKNSYRYGAYQALLEEKITRNEYEMLVEAGGIIDKLVSKVKGFFGGIGPGSEAFKKASSSKAFSSYLPQAQKGLKDIVDALRKYAGSVEGIDVDQVVNETLMGLLNSVGTTPKEIDDAEKAAKSGESGGESSSAGTGAESGETVTLNNPSTQMTLVRAAAQATGADPKAAEEKAGDMSADAVQDAVMKGFAKSAGVDFEKTKDIIDYITKNKLLKAESFMGTETVNSLNELSDILANQQHQSYVMERWISLAGIIKDNILEEAVEEPAKIDDILKSLPKMNAGALLKLVNNPALKKQLGDKLADFEKLAKDLGIGTGRIAKDVRKKIAEFLKSNIKSSAAPSGPEESKSSEETASPEAEKKFGKLADKIIGRLKGVKKAEIVKVLAALDGTPQLAVSTG